MATASISRVRWTAERRFYSGMTAAILAAVMLGFARSFFLRPLFPEMKLHSPSESFFYIHGGFFTAWFTLLVIQPLLVAVRRTDVHRRLGQLGVGLAAIMVVLGVLGGLIAARRPTGFIDIEIPPLQFLIVPLTDMLLFAIFVAQGFLNRRSVQSHKRYMLLASIAILDAAIARWPVEVVNTNNGLQFLILFLFFVPLGIWDIKSRGRIHAVTLWGSLTIIGTHVLRILIMGTGPWLAFAEWATGLLG